jgi:hypothetical protein
MKQHIIILLILFIIISLYNQCNKKNLNKLENDTIKNIIEEFSDYQEANASHSGEWGFKIIDITEGAYGGRSKQEVLSNIHSHDENDYITESEKNLYYTNSQINSQITNTKDDVKDGQERYLAISFNNIWLTKDINGILEYDIDTRYKYSSTGESTGEWGYNISYIIESKYKDYSLSDLFADISLSSNSPSSIPLLSSYVNSEEDFIAGNLQSGQINITHDEYETIKDRLEQKYTNSIILSNIFIPATLTKPSARCEAEPWISSDCTSTCGGPAVINKIRQVTSYFDVDGDVCSSTSSTEDIPCDSASYVCANPHTINVQHVLVNNRNKLQLVSFEPEPANSSPYYNDDNYSFTAMKELFGANNFVSNGGSEVIEQAIDSENGYIISTNKAYKLQWSNGPHTEVCEKRWRKWSSWTPSCRSDNYTQPQTRSKSEYQSRTSYYPSGTCNLQLQSQTQSRNKECEQQWVCYGGGCYPV